MPDVDVAMAPRDSYFPDQFSDALGYHHQHAATQRKIGRRESRLGLRGLFGRSKSAKEVPQTSSFRKSRAFESHALDFGTQASIGRHGRAAPGSTSDESYLHQSIPTLTASHSSHTLYSAHAPSPQPELTHIGAPRDPQPRSETGLWTSPPLYKAFSQAVRYAKLPAASISADSLLKLGDKDLIFGERTEPERPSSSHRKAAKEKSKSKKKHRRNTSGSAIYLDWDDKYYVLSNSGVLLQYSGHGDLNRLPEKILYLGPTSAAFASDAIPGRHWVIQISSSTDVDVQTVPESRSLFSKLPFKATDRRVASSLLLVFGSAEEMEEWMAAVRHEIQKLGGRRKLSETGHTTQMNDALQDLESQNIHHTRDSSATSQSTQDQNYVVRGEQETGSRPSDCSEALSDSDRTHARSVDGASTNSVISHDGRQLENLRDSTNRLSYLSSGQRTVITSAGSSPAPSPTISTFSHKAHDSQSSTASNAPEVRPRPNATAIANRRQSMHTGGLVEPTTSTSSTCTITQRVDGVISPFGGSHTIATPNFSVPISSSRRFSYVRTSTPEEECSPPRSRDGETLSRGFGRKAPPTTLRTARPLSIVQDQPSPMAEASAGATIDHGNMQLSASTEARPWDWAEFRKRRWPADAAPLRPAARPPQEEYRARIQLSPPRQSSLGGIQKTNEQMTRGRSEPSPPEEHSRIGSPTPRSPRSPPLSWSNESNSHSSSNQLLDQRRSHSVGRNRISKRSSMLPALETPRRPNEMHDFPKAAEVPPRALPPPTGPLPPLPVMASSINLDIDHKARARLNRRSMPQLATEGPPPAPPPTCALPPIPHSKQVRV